MQKAEEDVLSDERKAEVNRAEDPGFREVIRITRRHGISDNEAVRAHHARQIAELAYLDILGNEGLEGAARDRAIAIGNHQRTQDNHG